MDHRTPTQNVLIAVMCIFLAFVILVVAGCAYLHFKLKTTYLSPNNHHVSFLKTDIKPCAIETRYVETRIILSPSQVVPSPVRTKSQQPIQKPPARRPSRQLPHPPRRLSPPPPEDPDSEESRALLTKETLSITSICRSHSSENIHSDSDTSAYSLDHFQLKYLSSRSGSKESLKGREASQVSKEHEESTESGSFILCSVHSEK